jgi:hypothetical protein
VVVAVAAVLIRTALTDLLHLAGVLLLAVTVATASKILIQVHLFFTEVAVVEPRITTSYKAQVVTAVVAMEGLPILLSKADHSTPVAVAVERRLPVVLTVPVVQA